MKNLLTFILLTISVLTFGQTKHSATTHNNCVCSFDSTLERQVYTFVDSMPQYPGGTISMLSFFNRNFVYPKEQEEFQGSIHLTFIVEEDGKLSNIDSYNRNYNGKTLVDKEAIRIFKLMPLWIAGQCERKKIPVKMSMPINF